MKKKLLAMAFTQKDFIGSVNKSSFAVISSSFLLSYGAACVLNGTITPSKIELTTSLHKAFRILFLIWLVIIIVTSLTFLVAELDSLYEFVPLVIVTAIGALLFRLFLHVMYLLARNHSVAKIKSILEVNESDA